MKKFLRIIGVLLLVAIIAGAIFGYPAYQAIYAPNVPSDLENRYVDIPSNSTYDDVVDVLMTGGFIIHESSFRRVAGWMKFDKRKTMRAGRFEVKPEMTNRELISHLRVGEQATVDLVISYGRLLEDVAGKASTFIEADSLSILNKIQDASYVNQLGMKPETAMTLVIPNKYNFYWNTDANGFWKRMSKEHQKFWTPERLAKAKDLNLTKEEVYTLASIVEGETKYNPEKPRVAGVYLNRLRIGMPLQADPTVVFATRDFDTRRVTNKHLKFDSPYNTYMYKGLPPGPIMMASITSIDAVLNYESHKYLYFCAKPPSNINEMPKEHAFAKTLAQHNANARRYYKYLRAAGIR